LFPLFATLTKLEAKLAAGIVDTGGKFAVGVVDTGGQFFLTLWLRGN
jgi:hypothetical protein